MAGGIVGVYASLRSVQYVLPSLCTHRRSVDGRSFVGFCSQIPWLLVAHAQTDSTTRTAMRHFLHDLRFKLWDTVNGGLLRLCGTVVCVQRVPWAAQSERPDHWYRDPGTAGSDSTVSLITVLFSFSIITALRVSFTFARNGSVNTARSFKVNSLYFTKSKPGHMSP